MTLLTLWKIFIILFYIYWSETDYQNFGINYLTENYANFLFDGKTVKLFYCTAWENDW